jgi:hypothetical protein
MQYLSKFNVLTAAPSTGVLPADRKFSRNLHRPRTENQTVIVGVPTLITTPLRHQASRFQSLPQRPQPVGEALSQLRLLSSAELCLIDRGPFEDPTLIGYSQLVYINALHTHERLS